MIDIISTPLASTNAVALAQSAAQSLGWNLSTGQIEAAGTALVFATRYAHLEAPRIKAGIAACGHAAYRAGQWIGAKGGVKTIARRLIGPKGTVVETTPLPAGGTPALRNQGVPLNQNLGG